MVARRAALLVLLLGAAAVRGAGFDRAGGRRRGDDSFIVTDGAVKPGCSAPVGAKWDRWDMAGSTYNYCYAGCHMDWLLNNSARYNLSAYAGASPNPKTISSVFIRTLLGPTCRGAGWLVSHGF
jgi:hypothetical protein